MQTIHITGGRPLSGTLRPACAKNSVLPLLAASLLCRSPCAFTRVPRLSDVDTSLALLRFASSAAGGAHLRSTKYYLRFLLSSWYISFAVSARRIMRYCL